MTEPGESVAVCEAKVQRGMRDVEEGRVYSQEEVEKRMKRWVSE